jgi:predicted Zn-dependent protease
MALTACAAAPLPTKRPAVPVPTPDVSALIGSLTQAMFMMDRRDYGDEAIEKYVQAVGKRVAAAAAPAGLDITIQVVEDSAVNAWALPPAKVYISRAALAVLDSEAQLASILGHEIGHLVAKHPLHEFLLSSLGTKDDIRGVDIAAYDRTQEYQADRLGAEYARAAGYESRAIIDMLTSIYRVGSSCEDGKLRDSRIARLWQHVGSKASGETHRDRFLDRIDGLVYGDDPREGVVQAGRFTSSLYGVSFDLPSGWKAEFKDHRLTASQPDGRQMAFRRVTGSSFFPMSEAMGSVLQSSEFVQHSVDGIAVLKGTLSETARAALLTIGEERFVLTVSGSGRGEALDGVVSSLHRVRGDRVVSPRRIHVRRTRVAGRFDTVVKDCCRGSAAVDDLSRLNGIVPEQVVAAGYRVKCVW